MAVTDYHLQYDHEYERKVPYNVALIELVSRTILIGTINGTQAPTSVGLSVELDIGESAKGMPLRFRASL